MSRFVEVAVVGGGPAGAATAALLARSGRQVLLLERSPTWRWRASGVFASPAAVDALVRIGLDRPTIDRLARPIPAMRVEARDGTTVRLTYGDGDRLTSPAVGFDRAALDAALLGLARSSGVDVRTGAAVRDIQLGGHQRLSVRDGDGARVVEAAVVVGADGIRSTVARAAGVARTALLGQRVGLTFHVRDPRAQTPHDARMIVFDGGYCGLAPVTGGRLNVGIVLGDRRWIAALAADGAAAVVARVLAAVPRAADDAVSWLDAERCDRIEGAAPLGHRVSRRSGPGWLLVGDAAGFLDPFTGEGIHRSLVSAELAARAIVAHLGGRADALSTFDRAMTARFRTKDVVSLLVQAFLGRPPVFRYALRRMASRDRERETMGLVMGDLTPASRILDPRFLATLLRP
jgi:flavin-dependent dehydrogenase